VTSVSTYNVGGGTATNSNVVQALTIDSQLTGTGNLTKVSAGTLALTNTNNNFVGNLLVNQGVIAVPDDRALGAASNVVVLSPTTGTSTLRATDNITTGRTIQFAGTANTRAIEVVENKTLQLNAPFDLNAGAAVAANLQKSDSGILAINAANTGWT